MRSVTVVQAASGGSRVRRALLRTAFLLTGAALCVAFLLLQTGRHKLYFTHRRAHAAKAPAHAHLRNPAALHAALLFCYMVPVVYLVDHLARPIDYLVETMHAPAALGRWRLPHAGTVLSVGPGAVSGLPVSVFTVRDNF